MSQRKSRRLGGHAPEVIPTTNDSRKKRAVNPPLAEKKNDGAAFTLVCATETCDDKCDHWGCDVLQCKAAPPQGGTEAAAPPQGVTEAAEQPQEVPEAVLFSSTAM